MPGNHENGKKLGEEALKRPEVLGMETEQGEKEIPAESGLEIKTKLERPEIKDTDEHLTEKELQAAKIEMPKLAPASAKSKTRQSIENVLSDNLKSVYAVMPAGQKKKFRVVGEQTASKLELMMRGTRLKATKVLALIRHWLAIIPGANSFYLEQEAKIKTDQIFTLLEDLKRRGEI